LKLRWIKNRDLRRTLVEVKAIKLRMERVALNMEDLHRQEENEREMK